MKSKKDRIKPKIVLLAIMGIGVTIAVAIFGSISVRTAESFFRIPLSRLDAPINRTFSAGSYMDSALDRIARTPVAVDTRGRIYVLGAKDDNMRLVVVDRKGTVERTVTLRFEDGQADVCECFCVSPSGGRIWTGCRVKEWRVTAHRQNGQPEMDWKYQSSQGRLWRLYASGENAAYAPDPAPEVQRFSVGEKEPQRFSLPFNYNLSFHNEQFWCIAPLGLLAQQIGNLKHIEGWIGVAAWTPQRGARLVTQFKGRIGPVGRIYWIDERGNFYVFVARHNIPYFLVISPKGKILDIICVPEIVPPARGEKLEYGQLVKVDKTAIYLEVERVNEPREYRIVRIGKKPRWQVWLGR
jgi:hypothetical protein